MRVCLVAAFLFLSAVTCCPPEGCLLNVGYVKGKSAEKAYDRQGCQMAKLDPFFPCARVEGWGRSPRKGRDHFFQSSVVEP